MGPQVNENLSGGVSIQLHRGLDLSLRGRKAVAIPEALGDCQWDRHLAGHSNRQARRLSYQKPLAMTFFGHP